jgi:glycosyltransferase involved in cell wall biosynthesis
MRLCLISSEHDRHGGLGAAVEQLARVLALEHEVTVVHAYEAGAPDPRSDDPPELRRVIADLSRLPPIAFSCDDHARSAALVAAIEEVYGDTPPDYLEVPDYRGLGLVPLQARNSGNRSLRGCTIAVRLHGAVEAICMHDGTWQQPGNRILFDFEREVLRLADLVVWPGGDVLELYQRFLGFPLPVAERVRLPLEHPSERPAPAPRPTGEPLRILYAGRLQRVKGVTDLVEACMRLGSGEWRLTLIGGDTNTAPLASSMRETIETMAASEPRVTLLERISREALQEIYTQHDVLAVPSRFEVWPNVALEAMRTGLPVLATPVAGLTEIVEDGVTGWHTADVGREPLGEALEGLLASRDELERVRASGEVYRRFERLTAAEPVLDAYRDLLGRHRRPPVARRVSTGTAEPLVTGVIPYYGDHAWVGEAVDSLLSQTHRNLEVTIVNDGSFDPEDAVLAELAEDPRIRVLTQLNEGEQSARNLALIDAEGDYVAMLDADNLFEPEFVERAVAMLDADRELAYVTCWLRFFGTPAGLAAAGTMGYPPLGNGVRSDDAVNSDGDTIAVMPRRLFGELGYRYDEPSGLASDWALYRVFKEDGRYGAVIPEQLALYRCRDNSLSHSVNGGDHTQSWDETLSQRRARGVRWAKQA